MEGNSTSRPKSGVKVIKTSRTATGEKPKPQQKTVTLSEIQNLRVKTSQVDQQTKLLKTQLNRVKDQISSKTKAINKTVSYTADVKATNSFKTRTDQLNRSIQAAKDTKEQLEKQIELIKTNDKGTLVFELQEELKMAYCEYQRIQDAIADHQANGADNIQRLKNANAIIQDDYVKEIDTKINKIKNSNRDFKDKIIAHYKKLERNNIERELTRRNKEGKSIQFSKVEIDDTKRYRVEKYNLIATNLNEQSEKFESNVELLNNIINEQREKIVKYLTQQSQMMEIQQETARTMSEKQEPEEINIDF